MRSLLRKTKTLLDEIYSKPTLTKQNLPIRRKETPNKSDADETEPSGTIT